MKDYPNIATPEELRIIKNTNFRYGGSNMRLRVFKDNQEIFNDWDTEALGDQAAHRVAKVYRTEFSVQAPTQEQETVFSCVNQDCIDVAEAMVNEGLNAAILNLASNVSPCGGYHKGTSAQEEALSYSSTLSQSLYQFGSTKYKHIREANIPNVPGVYPMDINFGGIYSPCVTFFRNNGTQYYSFREQTFDCPIITVASLSNRGENDYTKDEGCYFNANGTMNEIGRRIEMNKIRTIYRIALDNGRDSLVLGAFGCGVFHLLPSEVSQMFYDILQEDEFKQKFKKITFAIFEKKPRRTTDVVGREGKFKAFYDLFGC